MNSKSSNIPLDASLKVNGFELNEDEKEKLDKCKKIIKNICLVLKKHIYLPLNLYLANGLHPY